MSAGFSLGGCFRTGGRAVVVAVAVGTASEEGRCSGAFAGALTPLPAVSAALLRCRTDIVVFLTST